jgi:hypothetical protein
VVALLALTLYARWLGPPTRRVLTTLAVFFTVLAIGHYGEVTVPALFGRPINLYWDGQHIPAVVAMIAKVAPWWLVTLVVGGLFVAIALVYAALRWAWGRAARGLTVPTERRALAAIGGGIGALFLLAPALHLEKAFASPVLQTFAQQATLLAAALSSGGADKALPPSPALASNLARLRGADVFLVFLESYGAITYDNAAFARALASSRAELAGAVADSKRAVVSAFVESPTFGGASWLAHASLLAGLEVRDPRVYDLLLTTKRTTLVDVFQRRGYRTIALMPGLRQDWPEGSFYGFDQIYGSRELGYAGPEFGWWRIPDQYALAKFDGMEVRQPRRKPLFVFFPTITTHLPFRPTPPYQPDWQRILSDRPFDAETVKVALKQAPAWTNPGPAYVDTLIYMFSYLAGYLRERAPRDLVLILVGDHQPPGTVTGPGASWEVPVHVITGRQELLGPLLDAGFRPGLAPARPAVGPMHELTYTLLRALGSGGSAIESSVNVPGASIVR